MNTSIDITAEITLNSHEFYQFKELTKRFKVSYDIVTTSKSEVTIKAEEKFLLSLGYTDLEV